MDFLNKLNFISSITKYTTEKTHPLEWDLTSFINLKEIFIDDICQNIPLINAEATIGKMVDWKDVDRLFLEFGIY